MMNDGVESDGLRNARNSSEGDEEESTSRANENKEEICSDATVQQEESIGSCCQFCLVHQMETDPGLRYGSDFEYSIGEWNRTGSEPQHQAEASERSYRDYQPERTQSDLLANALAQSYPDFQSENSSWHDSLSAPPTPACSRQDQRFPVEHNLTEARSRYPQETARNSDQYPNKANQQAQQRPTILVLVVNKPPNDGYQAEDRRRGGFRPPAHPQMGNADRAYPQPARRCYCSNVDSHAFRNSGPSYGQQISNGFVSGPRLMGNSDRSMDQDRNQLRYAAQPVQGTLGRNVRLTVGQGERSCLCAGGEQAPSDSTAESSVECESSCECECMHDLANVLGNAMMSEECLCYMSLSQQQQRAQQQQQRGQHKRQQNQKEPLQKKRRGAKQQQQQSQKQPKRGRQPIQEDEEELEDQPQREKQKQSKRGRQPNQEDEEELVDQPRQGKSKRGRQSNQEDEEELEVQSQQGKQKRGRQPNQEDEEELEDQPQKGKQKQLKSGRQSNLEDEEELEDQTQQGKSKPGRQSNLEDEEELDDLSQLEIDPQKKKRRKPKTVFDRFASPPFVIEPKPCVCCCKRTCCQPCWGCCCSPCRSCYPGC